MNNVTYIAIEGLLYRLPATKFKKYSKLELQLEEAERTDSDDVEDLHDALLTWVVNNSKMLGAVRAMTYS